jgi:ribonuclease G
MPRPLPPTPTRPIAELLREGQDIIVQVVKDPIGSKGARLTTQLSIPSRYLVLLPRTRVVGVSARIEDEAERARLKTHVAALSPAGAHHGYIVRTNAEGQPEEALAEDIAYLNRAWAPDRGKVRQRPRRRARVRGPEPAAAGRTRPDAQGRGEGEGRFARDLRSPARVRGAVHAGLAEKIEHYTGARPIFDLYGVEDEIQRALEKECR